MGLASRDILCNASHSAFTRAVIATFHVSGADCDRSFTTPRKATSFGIITGAVAGRTSSTTGDCKRTVRGPYSEDKVPNS